MLYKVLLEENGVELDFIGYRGYYTNTYSSLFNMFKSKRTAELIDYKLLNFRIKIGKGILGIIVDDLIDILVVVKDNQLFIDKRFEKNYTALYRKFKPIIQEYSDKNFDIVYTDYCGRVIFMEYKKPKFSTIKERDELVNSLLEEVYD
jgi:hypothetical protein